MTFRNSGIMMGSMEQPTPTRQLADILLGEAGPLDKFVADRRADGRSWRLISRDLWEATDRRTDITYETLRAWFPDEAEQGATDEMAS